MTQQHKFLPPGDFPAVTANSDSHTPFSQILHQFDGGGPDFRAAPSEDWRQGRTFFGGLSAALAVTAAQRAFPELPALRSAQFAFIGPVTGPLEMTPRLQRAGKSASFVEVTATSEAQTVFRATLLFGAPRHSAYRYQALGAPEAPAPEGLADFFDAPFAPRCTGQFEGRIAGGARPMSGTDKPELLLWIRHRDASAPDDVCSILALGDVPPPAAITMFTTRAMISTVTWSVDVIGTQFRGAAWHLAHVEAETVGEGYSGRRHRAPRRSALLSPAIPDSRPVRPRQGARRDHGFADGMPFKRVADPL